MKIIYFRGNKKTYDPIKTTDTQEIATILLDGCSDGIIE